MTARPALLLDIGSTVIKQCTRREDGRLSTVELVERMPGVPPGEQARELVERQRHSQRGLEVRVCSSAWGRARVGVLGLTRRHSIAAACQAVLAAGGEVVYARSFADTGAGDAPPVDILVLTGGADAADHRRLAAALRAVRLEDHPHRTLLWAGADAPEAVSVLPPHRQVANVLDQDLRRTGAGLAEAVHEISVQGVAGLEGLRALTASIPGRILPTPAVVGLAAERMRRGMGPLHPRAPFVLVDVGGTTTDVCFCANPHSVGVGRAAPILRRVFTDLGVAAHRGIVPPGDPELLDLAAAVAQRGARALYRALSEGDADALAPPADFLACLFLALRRLMGPGGAFQSGPGRVFALLVTGGACRDADADEIRRVAQEACGRLAVVGEVLVDRDYQWWAHGLEQEAAEGACGQAVQLS